MRHLIFFMHTSLDGFAGGPNGELNWININDEIFDFVGKMTDKADAGLYGRVTFGMMESYWPSAADQPNATKHDKEHAAWYKNAHKIVLSKSLNEKDFQKTTIIRDQLKENINKLKKQDGKDILIFGSPSASNSLLEEGLIDEFWLFVNPVLLGKGIPAFKNAYDTAKLKLIESKTFSCGVIALHYESVQN